MNTEETQTESPEKTNQDPPYGVLWDMDGTLVDTSELHYLTFKKIFDPLQIPFSYELFTGKFGMTTYAILRQMLGEQASEEEIERLSEEKEAAFREMLHGKVRLFPGVLGWLQRLHGRGIPMAVASSGSLVNITTLVDELQIRDYFVALVSSAGLPSKPDPAVFLKAAESIGVPPERCFVVEDAVAGVQAAKRAGMRCIAVTNTRSRAELSTADFVVDSLEELPDHFFSQTG